MNKKAEITIWMYLEKFLLKVYSVFFARRRMYGIYKKTLQELDLIDNFLSNAIASNQEVNELFYRQLLSVLLGKNLKKIRVQAQQIVPGGTPELRGIRMDVEITEYDEGTVTNVYDMEPHHKNQLDMPRHNRYYQAKIDGRYVRRGLKDFSAIPNLYVITITDYDIFGMDYMMYTVRNGCEEVPNLEYNDGLKFIYFYTKGTRGGSQAIKNMLTYFQNSDSKNAVDEATRVIDACVRRVKSLPEVEGGYMTFGDWIDEIKEDMEEEIRMEITEEVTNQVTKEVTDRVTKEVTDQVTKEVTDQVTKEVTDQVTKEVTDRVTKEVTDRVTKEVTDQVTKEVTDRVTDQVTKEVTDQVTKEVTDRVTKEVTDQITREMPDQVIKDVTKKVTGEMIEKNAQIIVQVFKEHHDAKEVAVNKLREKFPELADQAEEVVEKYWNEN